MKNQNTEIVSINASTPSDLLALSERAKAEYLAAEDAHRSVCARAKASEATYAKALADVATMDKYLADCAHALTASVDALNVSILDVPATSPRKPWGRVAVAAMGLLTLIAAYAASTFI